MTLDPQIKLKPQVRFLSPELIRQIIDESMNLLEKVGLEINNQQVRKMLLASGCVERASGKRVLIPEFLARKSIALVPGRFALYDISGDITNDFCDDKVHFTPGSSALKILRNSNGLADTPNTADYIDYVKLVDGLDNIASQSTAFIPADVPENVSDSYRLFLSLLYGKKPVVTGAFSIEGFQVMHDFQLAVRGSAEELKRKPLTVFTCCPTSPLQWSNTSAQNLVDCASYSIPVEIVPMPMTGFISPITITGTLIQQAAEIISGIVIAQMVNPGTPMLWGGSPTAFDIRYETTPMGAMETMMIDCGNNEIGSSLGLPTQGYIALSDSKLLDAQAGLETGIGATLAALSGINNISGPGMMDFENCFSLEKLILDNEIAGMCFRMLEGVEPRQDFPAAPLVEELLAETHLIIADHTLMNIKAEHRFPGPVIDRTPRPRWEKEGALTLGERAGNEKIRIIGEWSCSPLDKSVRDELFDRMTGEAGKYGMDELPVAYDR